MKIAFTMSRDLGRTDQLLAEAAKDLESCGIRTCGTVQINSDREDCHACDMDVKVLPNGPVIRISQSLGKEAKGCRLDPSALEEAVRLVGATIPSGSDLLIINKFGKHEAEGRGFREVIAEALSQNIPVLVELNQLNAMAFEKFTSGMAVSLPPEKSKIVEWGKTVSKCLEMEYRAS